MKIKTEYNVGEIVWCLMSKKLGCGKIDKITININEEVLYSVNGRNYREGEIVNTEIKAVRMLKQVIEDIHNSPTEIDLRSLNETNEADND